MTFTTLLFIIAFSTLAILAIGLGCLYNSLEALKDDLFFLKRFSNNVLLAKIDGLEERTVKLERAPHAKRHRKGARK